MSEKLTIFEELACVDVENQHFPLGDEGGRKATAGCVDRSGKIRHRGGGGQECVI